MPVPGEKRKANKDSVHEGGGELFIEGHKLYRGIPGGVQVATPIPASQKDEIIRKRIVFTWKKLSIVVDKMSWVA